MSAFKGIPLTYEQPEELADWDLVRAVLQEVREHLAEFSRNGKEGAIDLRALPHMGPDSYRHLKEALSTGEVTAVVEADIKVEISETQFPGVWWLTHRKSDGTIVTEFIEITLIPEILKTHVADVRAGLRRLELILSADAL